MGTVISVLLSFFRTHLLIYFYFCCTGSSSPPAAFSLVVAPRLSSCPEAHSQTRDQTPVPCIEGKFVTTGSPGKSPVSSFHTWTNWGKRTSETCLRFPAPWEAEPGLDPTPSGRWVCALNLDVMLYHCRWVSHFLINVDAVWASLFCFCQHKLLGAGSICKQPWIWHVQIDTPSQASQSLDHCIRFLRLLAETASDLTA